MPQRPCCLAGQAAVSVAGGRDGHSRSAEAAAVPPACPLESGGVAGLLGCWRSSGRRPRCDAAMFTQCFGTQYTVVYGPRPSRWTVPGETKGGRRQGDPHGLHIAATAQACPVRYLVPTPDHDPFALPA